MSVSIVGRSLSLDVYVNEARVVEFAEYAHIVFKEVEQIIEIRDEEPIGRMDIDNLQRCVERPYESNIGLHPPCVASSVFLAQELEERKCTKSIKTHVIIQVKLYSRCPPKAECL